VKEWITLKEASKITGKSVTALRMMIKRKKIDRAKKIRINNREHWHIHKEEVGALSDHDQTVDRGDQNTLSRLDQVITMPVETYLQQQKERDHLVQGMMMYRFKFEELDRKLKLLPAPVEVIAHQVEEQKEALAERERMLQDTQAAIQMAEEEKKGILSQLEAEKAYRSELEGHKQQAEKEAEDIREELAKIQKEREELATRLKKEKESALQAQAELEKEKEIKASLETAIKLEREKPWWKKLFGVR